MSLITRAPPPPTLDAADAAAGGAPAGGTPSPEQRRYSALVREAARIRGRAGAIEREVSDLGERIEATAGDEDVPAETVEQLEAKVAKLLKMNDRMSKVEEEVIQALRLYPALASITRMVVGFADDNHDTYCYNEDPLNSMVSPAHGHWLHTDLPDGDQAEEVTMEQAFAKMLGGRLCEVTVGSANLDVVDCIVIEPMGKQLDPDNFTSGGLVIVFHGLPACDEVGREWGEVLRMTRLLDGGITVAMPLLLAPDPGVELEDLRAFTAAAIRDLGHNRAVVWGKTWGGPWAALIAAMATEEEFDLRDRVVGLVVYAPTAMDAEACARAMALPTFLAWAANDAESDFEENSPSWVRGLRAAPPPTLWAMVDDGADHTPSVMAQRVPSFWGMEVGTATGLFIVICHLRAAIARHRCDPDDDAVRPEIHRLCEELPDHLSGHLDEDPSLHLPFALEEVIQKVGVAAAFDRLDAVVTGWLNANFEERKKRPSADAAARAAAKAERPRHVAAAAAERGLGERAPFQPSGLAKE